MLNYAIYLSGFDYTIEYRGTKENMNADYFSRFPLEANLWEDDTSVFQTKQIELMSVTRNDIKQETLKDETLRRIYNELESGAPNDTQRK